jgi:F-type H+-transporting ATPase subunit b
MRGARLTAHSPAASAVAAIWTLLFALPLQAAEEAAAPEKFLGLPVELWKTANLLLFLGLLVYFLGKPFNQFFRKRREGLDELLDRAKTDREQALVLAAEMRVRLSKIESEVVEIRRRGAEEGETEKAAQLAAAEKEAENLRRSAAEEIDRRLASAKQELARAASSLAAARAKEILAQSITDEDRKRLLDDSVQNISRIQ